MLQDHRHDQGLKGLGMEKDENFELGFISRSDFPTRRLLTWTWTCFLLARLNMSRKKSHVRVELDCHMLLGAILTHVFG